MRPVVGLDPSLTGTGFASDGTTETITTKTTEATVIARLRRLRRIANNVLVLTPAGSLVVIEGPSFASREQAGQAHLRAGLWWSLVNDLTASGCDLVEVPPKTLKKFATGSGNASKSDMRMALFKRGGLDLADDNQVDAWWLREAGLHLLGDPDAVALPKSQLDALEGLRGQLPAGG